MKLLKFSGFDVESKIFCASLCRMKKNLTYIIILFFVLIVSYGGSGVNLMVYCCGICQEKGILSDEKSMCSEISECFHSEDEDYQVCMHEHSFPCGVSWISFDWNSSVSLLPVLTPGVIDLAWLTDIAALTPIPFATEFVSDQRSGPPLLYPRLYLSIINRLII